jgi:misacylated tRNA(Ala) deacylase
MTDQLYLRDAYLKTMDAVVQEIRDGAVVLDRTVFYATGGGQPHDTGTLTWTSADGEPQTCTVVEVKKQGPDLLHKIDGEMPPVGMTVFGEINWDRRYVLMRYHTALHSVSGVIYRLFGSLVTGGQMYTDRARMDFALEDLSPERRTAIEDETNRMLVEGHPIHVTVLPRDEAFQIPDLIRTNINLLPPMITEVRIVNIEGIDQQADGGTHVANTTEVGRVRVTKSENKGRINKRLEIVVEN